MLNEAFHLDQDTPIREDFPEVWIFENVQKYDSLNPPSVSGNLTVLTVINLVLNALIMQMGLFMLCLY